MFQFVKFRAGWVLAACCTAWTAPATAFDIRPNCDIRTLGLSSSQHDKLHQRRQQYKDQLRQIQTQARQSKDTPLRQLLQKSAFDRSQALRIAQERYADDIQMTVAELNFYHDLFQMLDKSQQETWLAKCTRDFSARETTS